MKRWKKMLVSLLTVCMLFTLSAGSVLAAGEPYNYKITVYAGNKGTFGGASEKMYTASKGDKMILSVQDVQVTDEKYYVKGFRLSGHDNAEYLTAPSFEVKGDADYVVAYGIKGDQVAYTVNYQDKDGKELAPSGTFYGNVGDKPVVAYQYIEGFVPEALALTKTLSANEAENVFTFVYKTGVSGTVTETTEQTVIVNGPATPGGTTGGQTGGTGTQGGTGGTTGGNAAGQTGTQGGTQTGEEPAGGEDAENPDEPDVNVPDEDTPQDLVDLDDEETPGGNIDADEDEVQKGMPLAAGIAIIVVAVGALVVLIAALRKRSK